MTLAHGRDGATDDDEGRTAIGTPRAGGNDTRGPCWVLVASGIPPHLRE
ncbi:hypothetical protein [Streptomyces sp. NPDC096311]